MCSGLNDAVYWITRLQLQLQSLWNNIFQTMRPNYSVSFHVSSSDLVFSDLTSNLVFSDLTSSTVGRIRWHILEGFRFHNACLCCLGNMFSFLDNTLILSPATCYFGDNVYWAVARQWTSLYVLSEKHVLTENCLAMNDRSDMLSFRRHATLLFVLNSLTACRRSFVPEGCACHVFLQFVLLFVMFIFRALHPIPP
jgi:hypothetical protein